MERSELFERALASNYESNSIDNIVNEFVTLYYQAKKCVRSASAFYSNPGGPLLAGALKLHEVVDPASRDLDLAWADESKRKGELKLLQLKDKRRKLLDEIRIRKSQGIKITWDSEEAKQMVKELIDEADDYSKKAKEIRKLSIEIDKEKVTLINLLLSYKLI